MGHIGLLCHPNWSFRLSCWPKPLVLQADGCLRMPNQVVVDVHVNGQSSWALGREWVVDITWEDLSIRPVALNRTYVKWIDFVLLWLVLSVTKCFLKVSVRQWLRHLHALMLRYADSWTLCRRIDLSLSIVWIARLWRATCLRLDYGILLSDDWLLFG